MKDNNPDSAPYFDRAGSFYDENVYRAQIFQPGKKGKGDGEMEAIADCPGVVIRDGLDGQVAELIKVRNPQKKWSKEELMAGVEQFWKTKDRENYGLWVFYPWNGHLMRILPEEEFIELRTARNRHKITLEEQAVLREKKIGVIGLSVGQSVTLACAMERIGGTLRLADFDELELSNLNRIRTSLCNLGLPKIVATAREIAEIDPFICVEIFPEGIVNENLDAFLQDIDLLFEECDNIEIKIKSRIKCRERGIPVIMDTSDRGMLDIERFDNEPDRPLLHGKFEGLENVDFANLDKDSYFRLVLRTLDYDKISDRGKLSLEEVGKSISTWPQLATSVIQGGAHAAEAGRMVLLDQLQTSGRFYIDLRDVIEGRN